jgi:hypothetical protein
MWFTTSTKYRIVPYADKSYPEKARLKMEGEFMTRDLFTENFMWDNKPTMTIIFTRMK